MTSLQVKRKGLPFHEYGLVPVNAAKRHCSGQEADTSDPPKVTAEMINEFEAYKKDFSNQTVDHTFSRELDLGMLCAILFRACNDINAATAPRLFLCRRPGGGLQAGVLCFHGRPEARRGPYKGPQEVLGL